MTNNKFLKYQKKDFDEKYAIFYNENIKSIPGSVKSALQLGNQKPDAFLNFSAITKLAEKGYQTTENGYTFNKDGSFQVAVLTDMPSVETLMWDWWFGWHGCADNRYKLWHPIAHLSAEWADGNQDLESYLGRTSIIQEYIGKKLEKAAIQFVSPSVLGFTQDQFANKNEVVYICARIGYSNFPLDFGWLVHQIRKTDRGSEMRSRFFLGGPFIAFRSDNIFSKTLTKILQKLKRLPEQQAIDLMQHCSEEMNHLATFLPDLYKQYN